MKFSAEKKKSIFMYILEKIDSGEEQLSKMISETFNINQNTVHTYLNELLEKNIIRRIKRGQYELVSTENIYTLYRSNGEISSDTYAFNKYFKKYLKDMPQNIYDIWAYAFSEMMNNVMDHSEAEIVSFLVRQNYLNTEVYISDNGIGIFKKIMDHFEYPSLEEAIAELFKGKLTTDEYNHSGEGIFFSSKAMDTFFIISSGKLFAINKYDNSDIVDYVEERFGSIGTIVFMGLSNFSQKRLSEVFDEYSNFDSGFDKTILPLKNIFDTSPVSRSQAKRIVNRLDDFREVILDFEGIEWMGQGFAHQIFVVFAKEHPNVSVVPINMVDSVEKMYNHVKNRSQILYKENAI